MSADQFAPFQAASTEASLHATAAKLESLEQRSLEAQSQAQQQIEALQSQLAVAAQTTPQQVRTKHKPSNSLTCKLQPHDDHVEELTSLKAQNAELEQLVSQLRDKLESAVAAASQAVRLRDADCSAQTFFRPQRAESEERTSILDAELATLKAVCNDAAQRGRHALQKCDADAAQWQATIKSVQLESAAQAQLHVEVRRHLVFIVF